MSKKIKKQAKDEFKKGSKKITEEDIKKILKKEKELDEKFSNNGPLKKLFNDFKLLFSILKDYMNGNYREVPWFSIAAIGFSLLYVLNPIDIIPDFIPVFGYVDDAFVVSACLKLIKKDLHNYEDWKNNLRLL